VRFPQFRRRWFAQQFKQEGMFKVLEGGGIKATACRTFGLNSVMYADRGSDRIGGSEVVSHRRILGQRDGSSY
jgi:hypothetical protein